MLALRAIYAAQIALLVSPAVYQRTRREEPPGQAAATAPRATPPLCMPLTALLAGIVITLLFLASMDYAAIPGCGPAGAAVTRLPDSCFGLAQGFPLRFLTAYQGIPLIDKTALAEDWAQWPLVSFSVLYLLRLQYRRHEPVDGTPAVTGRPSSV